MCTLSIQPPGSQQTSCLAPPSEKHEVYCFVSSRFRAKRTSVAEYPRMSDHAFKNERQVRINTTTGPAQCTTPQPWPQKPQLTCWRRSGRAARRSICSSTVAEPPPLCTSPTRQHRTQQLPPCWTQMSPPQRKPLEARWAFWYEGYAVALSARQPRLQEIGGIEIAASRGGVHDAGMVGPQKRQHVVQESTTTTTRRRKASSWLSTECLGKEQPLQSTHFAACASASGVSVVTQRHRGFQQIVYRVPHDLDSRVAPPR